MVLFFPVHTRRCFTTVLAYVCMMEKFVVVLIFKVFAAGYCCCASPACQSNDFFPTRPSITNVSTVESGIIFFCSLFFLLLFFIDVIYLCICIKAVLLRAVNVTTLCADILIPISSPFSIVYIFWVDVFNRSSLHNNNNIDNDSKATTTNSLFWYCPFLCCSKMH